MCVYTHIHTRMHTHTQRHVYHKRGFLYFNRLLFSAFFEDNLGDSMALLKPSISHREISGTLKGYFKRSEEIIL